ncbi:MAG TPA: PhoU domain-containing protein [Acidimicrobiales bacterium]|nr:PhoU domain-containing protein [Acidimicrobiales bacterium]
MEDKEPRAVFHHDLAEVDTRLSELIHFVAEEVADATEALLREDVQAAVEIHTRRHLADPLYEEVERKVGLLMARQAPVAGDLRYLLAVLRAVPELERSADLAEQIARRGAQGIASQLPLRGRALVTRTGDVVTAMWQELCRCWDNRLPNSAEGLEAARDELDDLHTSLTAEVAASSMPASVTMDMALVGRFYERLGDHAVYIAGRLDGLTAWPAPAPG